MKVQKTRWPPSGRRGAHKPPIRYSSMRGPQTNHQVWGTHEPPPLPYYVQGAQRLTSSMRGPQTDQVWGAHDPLLPPLRMRGPQTDHEGWGSSASWTESQSGAETFNSSLWTNQRSSAWTFIWFLSESWNQLRTSVSAGSAPPEPPGAVRITWRCGTSWSPPWCIVGTSRWSSPPRACRLWSDACGCLGRSGGWPEPRSGSWRCWSGRWSSETHGLTLDRATSEPQPNKTLTRWMKGKGAKS